MRQMVRCTVVLFPAFVALVVAACSPLSPATPLDSQQLNSIAPAQLTNDPELRGVVRAVSPIVARGLGFETVVTIDGKEWGDRNRGQQERILQKIGAQMQAALHSVQSGPPYNTFSARLINDLGHLFGYVIVGGVNDTVTYSANR